MVLRTTPHILIIDDDPVLSGLLKAQLEAKNFIVTVAKNCWKGMDLIRDIVPAIILLDTAMPEKDGFTILEELKHDQKTSQIPVILLANTARSDERERAILMGAANYLPKVSVRSEDIRHTIAKYTPVT